MPDRITIRNAGPGPIVVAGTYLYPSETRDVTRVELAAARSSLGQYRIWLVEPGAETTRAAALTEPPPDIWHELPSDAFITEIFQPGPLPEEAEDTAAAPDPEPPPSPPQRSKRKRS